MSGTGETGSTVVVTLGGETMTATVGASGTWSVTFTGSTFPADGDYSSSVVVTAPGGAVYNLDGPDYLIDMTRPPVAITEGAQSTGDIENASEHADGITIRGTSEPGATIRVVIDGHEQTTTVGGDGGWNVTFPTSDLPEGTYTKGMLVTATDIHGNVTTLTDTLAVDTETSVRFDANLAGGDDLVNQAERAAGDLVLPGTAEAGATVLVQFGTGSRSVTADAQGRWSAAFSAGEYAAGTYTGEATVTATDLAGNTATQTHLIDVDTEVSPLSHWTDTPGTDGVVNGAEAAGGLLIEGTVEAGSVVTVQLASGRIVLASVNSDGSWSAQIPASDLPTTETNNLQLTVNATDPYGNTATQTSLIDVDPLVRNFHAFSTVTNDNVVNRSEAQTGFAISGTVEPGATVAVTLENGAVRTVTAQGDGTWTAVFTAADLPGGSGAMSYTAVATDAAQNTATTSGSFSYDLVTPDAPVIGDVTNNGNGTRGLYADVSEGDHYVIETVAADGTVTLMRDSEPMSTPSEDEYYSFNRVPDGQFLVVTDSDTAGNEMSTLLVVSPNGSVTMDLDNSGLSRFDFGSIDLHHASVDLTITAEQLQSLTGGDNDLIVRGDANDRVTALGATDTGATASIDGHSYSIYTLGDEGHRILIDDSITNVTI